jgi:hypothetical protein
MTRAPSRTKTGQRGRFRTCTEEGKPLDSRQVVALALHAIARAAARAWPRHPPKLCL